MRLPKASRIPSRKHVHPNQIKQWKEHLLAGIPEVVDGGVKKAAVRGCVERSPRSTWQA